MTEQKKPAAGVGAARRMEDAQRIIDAKALGKLQRDVEAAPERRREHAGSGARSGK